ncbi:hypothetical protein YYC_04167 [Plasmodium yoelii 17X]|uniref:Uncharacterized protein n=1 Tax=Plasmodium yoelii 17X TaxID=1323249 RepID=V7PH53_PLAYE|nr:hypothetical protein YYC_04167 [Plasmodium yoelii 17X]
MSKNFDKNLVALISRLILEKKYKKDNTQRINFENDIKINYKNNNELKGNTLSKCMGFMKI